MGVEQRGQRGDRVRLGVAQELATPNSHIHGWQQDQHFTNKKKMTNNLVLIKVSALNPPPFFFECRVPCVVVFCVCCPIP